MSDSKIVSLHGQPIPEPGTVNKTVVDDLARILEMAKNGEITGFVFAVTHKDETVSVFHNTKPTFRLIGALQACVVEFCDAQNK